jgi:hypothetical protein
VWNDDPDNHERCRICKKTCADDLEEPPCADCKDKPPEVHPLAELAYHIYYNVRNCRNGEFLDFNALFRFMELSEISPDAQLDVFHMVRAVESDWHRREMEKLEQERNRKQES